MTKEEMIKDLLDFGKEKLETLDDDFDDTFKFLLTYFLAMQLAKMETIDGRNKKNLKNYLNQAKKLFLQTYQDVINREEF